MLKDSAGMIPTLYVEEGVTVFCLSFGISWGCFCALSTWGCKSYVYHHFPLLAVGTFAKQASEMKMMTLLFLLLGHILMIGLEFHVGLFLSCVFNYYRQLILVVEGGRWTPFKFHAISSYALPLLSTIWLWEIWMTMISYYTMFMHYSLLDLFSKLESNIFV